MGKKKKDNINSVPFGFIQVEGDITPTSVTTIVSTGTTVHYAMDKKGRMRDHNGKKILVTYTS